MTKPFNIHDWQAKQAKQRLAENDDAYQKRQDAQTPGKNPDFFYDDDSIMSKLKKDPDYIKKLNTKNTKKDVSENTDANTERKINNFIKSLAKYNDYTLQAAVNVIMRVLRSQNYDGVNEHHGDDFPKGLLDKKVSSFLDDLKKKSETDYDAIEDIMKKHFSIDEMNSLGSAGAGASFQAGDGDAYATPNAFGDDKKKKMKAYKSIGYKKV
tara:strand:+ start:22 stop:654 length:633 start_codon:yes stop_codon:yes gene_type:complete